MPVASARAAMTDPAGFDRSVWVRLGTEIGLQGLHVPERYGGAGYGYAELGIVLEQMGAVLYPGRFSHRQSSPLRHLPPSRTKPSVPSCSRSSQAAAGSERSR